MATITTCSSVREGARRGHSKSCGGGGKLSGQKLPLKTRKLPGGGKEETGRQFRKGDMKQHTKGKG